MNQGERFRTAEEEVLRLLEEMGTIRQLLREIAAKVSKMELRVKRAFPSVAAIKQTTKARSASSAEPNITPEEALGVYDRVVQKARAGAPDEAGELLNEMSTPNLVTLYKELGLSLSRSKPSKKTLIKGIMGRVKQSVMLSQHSSRRSISE